MAVSRVPPVIAPGNLGGSSPTDRIIGRRGFLAVVARNAAFVLGAQVALKILAFLFNIYVVRRLGAAQFGQYASVMAYVAIFSVFTDLGMSFYTLREMARDRTEVPRLLPSIVLIRIILSLPIIIIAPLSAFWFGKRGDVLTGILLASIGLILYAFQGPMDGALTAHERLDYSASFAVVNQLVFWILGFLLLLKGMGLLGLIVATMAGLAMSTLCSAWALSRIGIGPLIVSFGRWRRLLAASWPFAVCDIAQAFVGRFDTVFMSFVLNDAAVGWYNVPWTLMNMALLIAQSIAVAMFPSLVRSHAEDPDSLQRVSYEAIKYLLVVCLPITVGGTVLADRIIISLYGKGFVNSIPVLQLILWALPSLFLLEFLGRVMITLRMERLAARINVINAGVVVLLDLILVPTLGIVGAALALLCGRSLRLVQCWRQIGNDQLVGRRWGVLLRVALAGVVMGVTVLLLGGIPSLARVDSRGGLALLVCAGAIVYGVALLALGGIERREVDFLRNLILERLMKGSGR